MKNGSELVISDVFEGRGGVFSPIVTISAPIYDRNQFNGFALAALKIDHINSIIKRIAGNRMGEITIIDSKYKVIASTVPGRDVLTLYRADSFWDLLEIENGLFQGFRKEDAQRAEMTKWNNSVFIKAIPTSINENWQIIVEIATRPFITQLNQFYISGLLFLFLLSIVSIILSIIVSTATVKSLLQLQRSSQDLSEHIEKGETVESWPKAEVARSSLEVAKLDPKGL